MDRTRVLIVDDHADVIVGLRALLETDDSSQVVGDATSGRQAIERAHELRPDIVVMDFSMGDMDGVDAASAIRSDNPDTVVLILSIYEAEEHAARAKEAGVRRWIPKSQPPDVLLRELRQVSEELRSSH